MAAEENLEQGSADYEELAANNGVVVTDSEDHLLSMFYGYTPAVGDVLTFESMDGKAIEVTAVSYTHLDVYKRQPLWRRKSASGTGQDARGPRGAPVPGRAHQPPGHRPLIFFFLYSRGLRTFIM